MSLAKHACMQRIPRLGLCALLASLYALAPASVALADDCPTGSGGGGTTAPPSGNVVVTILSVHPNSDLEGDDDYVPFYDNHADIFGTVTIAGESFSLPEISDDDFPHWTSGNRFVKHVTAGAPVPISISIKENDWGLTGANDTVDVSPDPAKDQLDLALDTCSLRVVGDTVNAKAQGVIEVKAGNEDTDATIRLRVEMEDGRALTSNDIALTDFDLIQVRPQVNQLVAGKPTVGFVRVANNTPTAQPVSVRLRVLGPGDVVLADVTESMGTPLAPGEVRKKYLLEGSPLVLAAQERDYAIRATATTIHSNPEGVTVAGATLARVPTCRQMNDTSGALSWRVITTTKPSFLWIRVGGLLDIGNLASEGQEKTIRDLGIPFINGVYPIAGSTHSTSGLQLTPPVSAVMDFLFAILGVTGIPFDAVLPFALVFELNGAAALAGVDRLMGVLPHEWFHRFRYGLWDDVTGLSLGDVAPRAVIFQADGDGGPSIALPAHEFGHTYRLSTDPTIKNSWACSVSGDVGTLLCGAAHGFDEYVSDDHPNGVDTWGYWVPQGGEPAWMAPMMREQCSSHCVMGPSPSSAVADLPAHWGSQKKWIDAADYDQLLARMKTSSGVPFEAPPAAAAPDVAYAVALPRFVYVSGMIASDDRILLGKSYELPARPSPVDFLRNEEKTPYALRFYSSTGGLLSEIGLRANWNYGEYVGQIPITMFAGATLLPGGTQRIEIWNRHAGRRLALRMVSRNYPVLTSGRATVSGTSAARKVRFDWSATDLDGDRLTHFVQVRPAGTTTWAPAVHEATAPGVSIDATGLAAGRYEARLLSSDGVHLGSTTITFDIAAALTNLSEDSGAL